MSRTMRTVRRRGLIVGTAIATVAAATANAAQAGIGLFPSTADRAICDGVFAQMTASERGADASLTTSAVPALPDDMLQACSYDGQAFRIDASALTETAGTQGDAAVREIMRFTGLPQNFKVVEGKVPNAAALIVIGKDRIPQRIIAYNPAFMERVRAATESSDWAAVSIMAHEIGHHLSGHTLTPGGSQPPTELEADRFSGFVLFKMGATLGDAQAAISTLVREADGPTHPGRAKRLVAIESGWAESCTQQARADCNEAVAMTKATPAMKPAASETEQLAAAVAEPPAKPRSLPPGKPATGGAAPDELAGLSREQLDQRLIALIAKLGEPDADIAAISRQIEDVNAAAAAWTGSDVAADAAAITPSAATLDRLPSIEPGATPSKFDRFVYDTVGIFDPAIKEALAKAAYDFAAANDVEIVTVVTDELGGRSAEAFALEAMRQLRVGKLEVGNGAVLVVAPASGRFGIALGPGLLVEYETPDPLLGYLERYVSLVDNKTRPAAASELIAEAAYRIMRDTKPWEWAVRFRSLEEMLEAAAEAEAALAASGEKYDPAKDPTWRKLARIHAEIVSVTPAKDDDVLDVSTLRERSVGPAIHVRTADGRDALVYANPSVASLMPVALEEGGSYAFVVREAFLHGDTPQFDLISYDRVD